MTGKVDAIISAFNEVATVAAVVQATGSSELVRRVIVVSDGSMDGTAGVAREQADLVIETSDNRGKGGAMRLGAGYADSEVLLFLDADLLNLNGGHIEKIVAPVLAGDLDMNVGVVSRGPVYTWLSRYTPKISGQRTLRRKVLEATRPAGFGGYGAEMELNSAARRLSAKVGFVLLRDMSFVKKFQKIGWARAIPDYLKMFFTLTRAWFAGALGRF